MGKIDNVAVGLHPSPGLLCKLGSIVVHIDEGLSVDGHRFDMIALQTLLADEEVKVWLDAMNAMAMLPVKRNSRTTAP